MYSDNLPLPSYGYFYENKNDYIEVYHLTTEDEIMMTSPNLFNKGDVLNRLIEKTVCKHNDIKLDDILVNDKEFILLWLRESAYGNVIEFNEIKDGKSTEFYFDTRNIRIETMSIPPDDGKLFTYIFNKDYTLKLKLLTIGDEKKLPKNINKIDYYCNFIFSINGNEDRMYINSFLRNQSIMDGRKIKKYIDKINFGVKKDTTCLINKVSTKTSVDINELFFGYSQENLGKITKALNDGIFFLLNEGQGYTNSDVLKMPTWSRKNHEEKLIEKINKMNEQIKQK